MESGSESCVVLEPPAPGTSKITVFDSDVHSQTVRFGIVPACMRKSVFEWNDVSAQG